MRMRVWWPDALLARLHAQKLFFVADWNFNDPGSVPQRILRSGSPAGQCANAEASARAPEAASRSSGCSPSGGA